MPLLGGFARPTQEIPDPDPYTTLAWMVRATQMGLQDAAVRLWVEQLVRDVFPHDYLSEYAAILQWVRSNIRYTRDPIIVEQVKTARVTLETEVGDCDCMSVLIGTLCAALGAQVRYVAGAFDYEGGEPNWAHVWVEAYDPATKAWVVLDPVPGRNVDKMLDKLVDTIVVDATE